MKKLFTLALTALLLGTAGASAQTLRRTWDFREGFSQKTINALKGDQEEFGPDKYWRNYESDATKADEQHFWNASKDAKNADGFAATHNGGQERVIDELAGLKLGMSNAKKFVITYNGATYPNEFESDGGPALGEPIPHGKSYVWLNGKNETIAFDALVNQTIKIAIESHAVNRTKLGEARGISLTTSAGTLTPKFEGNPVPTYYTEYEWDLTGNEGDVATLTIKSTNGCHIYYIIVGEGDDPNANKTKLGYLTSGDAASEAAYQLLAQDETTVVTPIDAATFSNSSMLAGYDATVVSPTLPADNSAVATLKSAISFYPIVNLNASLYDAWGYGKAMESDPIGVVTNKKSGLLAGFEENDTITTDGVLFVMLNQAAAPMVELGDYFAGDEAPLVSIDSTLAAAHIHNPYHNAYIYVPYTEGATEQAGKLLMNAIDMAKSSKSDITEAPAPKIKLDYKDLNTNITLSMASSTLPKPQIFYTLDGSTPTVESTQYTDVINVTAPCTVKAAALAEGYLLSPVAEAQVEIFSQPAQPVISSDYQEGKTIVTLSSSEEGVDLWYSFSNAEVADTTKSMKYTEPLTVALPTDFSAFAVSGGQVFSELAQQRVVVKNAVVRQDEMGKFDANAAEWQQGGSGSTVYYFSWGKTATSIYDNTQEGTTTTDPDTGDEVTVYPERDYEVYAPADEEGNATSDWQVKSKGQVMIWQSLSVGSDPGNDAGYNPETTGDIISYAKITNNDVQFGGKVSGERCTGVIESVKKFQAPFDVVTYVGTAAGGDNVGKMVLEVSADGETWTAVGDTLKTSTVKRLWKGYVRSYEGTDEVFVRIAQAGGGSSVQIYNIYVLNQGEKSQELAQQYNAEFEAAQSGITTVVATRTASGIYNLNGMRQQQLQHGLNIVVDENGKARKVLLK